MDTTLARLPAVTQHVHSPVVMSDPTWSPGPALQIITKPVHSLVVAQHVYLTSLDLQSCHLTSLDPQNCHDLSLLLQ